MMDSLSISGNYFFNAHLTLDVEQMKGCKTQETRISEMGVIEAFIDKWFTHGNKAKAIDAFNILLNSNENTAKKDEAIAVLKGMMPVGHETDIGGSRSRTDFGQFTVTINQTEITCLSNYKAIHDIKQRLIETGDALTKFKSAGAGKDFLYYLAQNQKEPSSKNGLKGNELQVIRDTLPCLLRVTPKDCDIELQNEYSLGSCDSEVDKLARKITDARFGNECFHRWQSTALTLTEQGKAARVQARLENNVDNMESQINRIGETCLALSQYLSEKYPQPASLPVLNADV